MRLDAYATLQWVLRHKVLQATKIVLVGTSLGGCVAIAVAAANAESVIVPLNSALVPMSAHFGDWLPG